MEIKVPEAIPMPAGPQPNITMWGAPGSGKTTFLAALSIALLHGRNGWRVRGTDAPSVVQLRNVVRQLASERRFPPPTEALERFNWEMLGESPERQPLARRSIFQRGKEKDPGTEPAAQAQAQAQAWSDQGRKRSVRLDLLDPPGRVYGTENPVNRSSLMDSLVHSHGIVYLYDPVGEQESQTTFEYFQDALFELDGRIQADGRDGYGRLPHRVAVCITKFDHRRVLLTADEERLLDFTEDSVGLPTISNENAAKLFEILCKVSGGPAAQLIQPMIERFFHPTRTRYFVTSSIGFYIHPDREVFDFDDFENVFRDPGGTERVRGAVKPINVMEPLMWLGLGEA